MPNQQYSISGTVAVGQTLTVVKSGDDVADDSATYKWQSSSDPDDPITWSDITGATSDNYTIVRGDRYKYLRAEVTDTSTGNIAYTEKTILVPLETNQFNETFNYTGAAQTWTVPVGVTSVSVDAYGAKGGSISAARDGGNGGRVKTNLTVTPGETLHIYVGEGPGWVERRTDTFGGGGRGWGTWSEGIYASAGGGATDIRIGGNALDNRVIVAGGGGAGGKTVYSSHAGGDGGGLIGKNGLQVGDLDPYVQKAGAGGTQVTGGLGGKRWWRDEYSTMEGTNGSKGKGGRGGTSGGGGGWYGGGATGGEDGGGGGSSYTHPTLATPIKVGSHWPLFLSQTDADNNSSDGNSTEITITGDSNGMNTSFNGGVRYYKPNNYKGTFTESQMTVHTRGARSGHGQLILEWSSTDQQYEISGTVAVGQTLTVSKSGHTVADSTNYQWQSYSDETSEWSNIDGESKDTYTITRSDRYKYLRVKATYFVNSREVDTVILYAPALVPLESEREDSVTFNYTGDAQTWTVPGGVISVSVDAYGASGSVTSGEETIYRRNKSGLGGRVKCDLAVTQGEVLNIYVGGRGETSCNTLTDGSEVCDATSNASGGWNGGGNGGWGGDAGGGATDIRINGTSLNDRVIVAGGGGGGAETGFRPSTDERFHGGSGGGFVGGNGMGSGGDGGSQTAAGGGGYYSVNDGYHGHDGSFGIGGNSASISGETGGGGGGGWYGGGGGVDKGGGGGGSSYTDPSLCSNVVHKRGVQLSNGKLILQWRVPIKEEYAISGTGAIGQSLTIEKLGDSDVADSVIYQWQRYDGTSSWDNITGATNKTYMIKGPDENKKLRAKVTYSVNSTVVDNIPTNEVTISFDMGTLEYAISGTVEIGKSLSVTKSGSLPNWMPAITDPQYEWQRSSNGSDWSAISSATNSEYKVMGPDEGKYLRAKVTITIDDFDFTKTLYIESTIAVPAFVLQDYVITGNAENGETITVNETTTKLPVGTIDSTSYQWQKNDGSGWTNISDATNKQYTLASIAEERSDIRVNIEFNITNLNVAKTITVIVEKPRWIKKILGLNLSGKDLRGKNLSNIKITSLRGSKIDSTTKFTNANLTGADVTNINDGSAVSALTTEEENIINEVLDLSGKNLTGLDLTGLKITNLKGATIDSDANFSGCDLTGCDFTGLTIV